MVRQIQLAQQLSQRPDLTYTTCVAVLTRPICQNNTPALKSDTKIYALFRSIQVPGSDQPSTKQKKVPSVKKEPYVSSVGWYSLTQY